MAGGAGASSTIDAPTSVSGSSVQYVASSPHAATAHSSDASDRFPAPPGAARVGEMKRISLLRS